MNIRRGINSGSFTPLTKPNRRRELQAFTLVETIVTAALIVLFFATGVLAYVQAAKRAQQSGYSMAAEALAVRQIELVRSALWDTQTVPDTDWTTNIATLQPYVMELPFPGTNAVWATNFMTITNITLPGTTATMKMITVSTKWPWNGGFVTNTLVSYRCPDQ